MKILMVALSLAFSAIPSFSQDARYETVTASLNQTGGTPVSVTNQVTIADFETGQVVAGLYNDSYSKTTFTKNGVRFDENVGAIIRGPATFSLTSTTVGPGNQFNRFMTVKITPVSFPPDKTLIVPPGTNQVQISLESSTNLVNWATATNGVYGSPIEAQFFRLKMTPLN